jgi:hypothetical protein
MRPSSSPSIGCWRGRGTARLLYHTGPDCTGFEVGALWDEATIGMRHLGSWELGAHGGRHRHGADPRRREGLVQAAAATCPADGNGTGVDIGACSIKLGTIEEEKEGGGGILSHDDLTLTQLAADGRGVTRPDGR